MRQTLLRKLWWALALAVYPLSGLWIVYGPPVHNVGRTFGVVGLMIVIVGLLRWPKP
jgi:hypothetical protein